MWARTLGSLAVTASCVLSLGAGLAEPASSGPSWRPLNACGLLGTKDARQLLGPQKHVAQSVPLPGVNSCAYFAAPGWVKDHLRQSESIGVTLFIDFRNVSRGTSRVRVRDRVVYWSTLPGDKGVMSFTVRPNSFVVLVSGNRLSATARERLAERATRIVLVRVGGDGTGPS